MLLIHAQSDGCGGCAFLTCDAPLARAAALKGAERHGRRVVVVRGSVVLTLSPAPAGLVAPVPVVMNSEGSPRNEVAALGRMARELVGA